MKNIAVVILSILILSSCSANWHLKRAIKKDPRILAKSVMIKDTVRFFIPSWTKSVQSPEIYFDTIKITNAIADSAGITHAQASTAVQIAIANYAKALERDTLIIDTLNIRAISYYKNGKPHLQITQNDTTYKKLHTTECPPSVIYKKTFFDYVPIKAIIIIMVLLLAAYLVKNLLKK